MKKRIISLLFFCLIFLLIIISNSQQVKAETSFFSQIKEKFNGAFDIGYNQGYWIIDSTGKNCTNVTKEDYLKNYEIQKYYKTKARCLASITFKNETGFLSILWQGIKGGTGWTSDKFLFILGVKNLGGEDIGISRISFFLGGGFGGYLGAVIIFIVFNSTAILLLYLINKTPGGIISTILSNVIVIGVISGLWVLTGVFAWQHLLTGILACAWLLLFYFLAYFKELIFDRSNFLNHILDLKLDLKLSSGFIIILFIYPLLMAVPITIRIIQIITLEVLMPDSWFIRSFILAFYIGIVPLMFRRYRKYKERNEKYEDKLKQKIGEKVAEEIASA